MSLFFTNGRTGLNSGIKGLRPLFPHEEMLSDFLSDFNGLFAKSEVTDSIVSIAIELTKRRALRGYDSVHLASVIMLNAEIKEGLNFNICGC